MNNSSFDEFLRNNLEGDEVEVRESGWNQMQQMLDRQMPLNENKTPLSAFRLFMNVLLPVLLVGGTLIFVLSRHQAGKKASAMESTPSANINKNLAGTKGFASASAHINANPAAEIRANAQAGNEISKPATGAVRPALRMAHSQLMHSTARHRNITNAHTAARHSSGNPALENPAASASGRHETMTALNDPAQSITKPETMANLYPAISLAGMQQGEELTASYKGPLSHPYVKDLPGLKGQPALFSFGITAGAGTGVLGGEGGLSPYIGLYGKMQFTPALYVQAEGLWSLEEGRNYKATSMLVRYTEIVDSTWEDVHIKQMSYLQVPLTVGYNITDRFSVYGGARFSYLLGTYYHYDYFHAGQLAARSLVKTEEGWSAAGMSYNNGLNKMDIAAVAGMQVQLGRRLSADIRANIGLSDVTVNNYYSNNIVNRNSSISVSLNYKLY